MEEPHTWWYVPLMFFNRVGWENFHYMKKKSVLGCWNLYSFSDCMSIFHGIQLKFNFWSDFNLKIRFCLDFSVKMWFERRGHSRPQMKAIRLRINTTRGCCTRLTFEAAAIIGFLFSSPIIEPKKRRLRCSLVSVGL